MRLLSRFLVHTPARFLEDEYSISYTTILRIDKEVLENDIPNPKMQNVQGVLVDEKFLGSSQDAKATLRELSVLNRDLYIGYLLKEQFRQVFQTKEVNTATLRLILWMKMCMKSNVKFLRNFARKISEQFNEVMNGIRYRLNSARIESTNAAIKRIQAKACGLFDVSYLFLKLRQVYFLRLQRKHKTGHSFYQQI